MSDKAYIVITTISMLILLIACISLLCIKDNLKKEVLVYQSRIKTLQDKLPNVESDHIKWPNSLGYKRKR